MFHSSKQQSWAQETTYLVMKCFCWLGLLGAMAILLSRRINGLADPMWMLVLGMIFVAARISFGLVSAFNYQSSISSARGLRAYGARLFMPAMGWMLASAGALQLAIVAVLGKSVQTAVETLVLYTGLPAQIVGVSATLLLTTILGAVALIVGALIFRSALIAYANRTGDWHYKPLES